MTAMALKLGVPVGFFARPLVDTHEGFFRSLRRTSVSHRRQARALAHVAHDLATSDAGVTHFLPVDLPKVAVDGLTADRREVEAAAAYVRASWGLSPGPVDDMVRTLEEHGVVVMRMPLATPDVDAFSLPFPDRPVIVLGADKNDRARSRFDAAHELGHLVMHDDQVWGVKEVETQAHRFAAAFLMPEADIYDALPSKADWALLFELKKTWQVSLAALLMRAKTLGKMSETDYLSAVKVASARGWRRVEPVPLAAPEVPAHLLEFLQSNDVETAAADLPAAVVSDLLLSSRG
jgi:Zn-dependent peptidase ImmA (M78 family)